MRYTFKAKNTTVTDALKEKITSKIDRLERLFPENTDINVTLSVVKLDHKIEVTVNLPKRVLRAEVTRDDMYVAIDEVVDKLEKQMVKYKNRLRDKSRRDVSFTDELKAISDEIDTEYEEDTIKIDRTKKFEIKPMDPEEAVMEMELISHNFFVFRNATTDDINVVYKRKDGSYGLIDPEY
ncbi:ribosome hibernation-promoting factor, HPF/YfiA family [[Clostridium] colinum]|uniref:ribosome hibernation-promoting factor, HPF/YfiA family n=1 Tax=[Clostridium] colinum TaxID=36835 RepID=UPI0020258FD4|nr:ribosome-associated translation inhibitor RaiA [[Clostridium] colinum]